jgi:hypothetical protein
MTDHILTALYDEKGAAESGRADLLALGVPASDVAIRGAEALTDPIAAERFWQRSGAAVIPEADRFVFDEAVRRGGYLVTARVPGDKADRTRDMLEHLGPIDLDERLGEWRRAGWRGHAAGTRGEVAPGGEPALAHPPAPDDPVRAGAFGESVAYAAEPGGHGTVRRRVRAFPL